MEILIFDDASERVQLWWKARKAAHKLKKDRHGSAINC